MCAALPPLCIDSTLARHPRGGHPGTHNVPAIRPPAGKAEGEAPVTPPGMEQLHPRTHLPMSLYASDPSAGGSGGSSAGGDPGGDQAGAQRASWRSWWRGRGRQAQQGEGPPAQQQQQQQQGPTKLWELGPGQQIKAMVRRLDAASWKAFGNVSS